MKSLEWFSARSVTTTPNEAILPQQVLDNLQTSFADLCELGHAIGQNGRKGTSLVFPPLHVFIVEPLSGADSLHVSITETSGGYAICVPIPLIAISTSFSFVAVKDWRSVYCLGSPEPSMSVHALSSRIGFASGKLAMSYDAELASVWDSFVPAFFSNRGTSHLLFGDSLTVEQIYEGLVQIQHRVNPLGHAAELHDAHVDIYTAVLGFAVAHEMGHAISSHGTSQNIVKHGENLPDESSLANILHTALLEHAVDKYGAEGRDFFKSYWDHLKEVEADSAALRVMLEYCKRMSNLKGTSEDQADWGRRLCLGIFILFGILKLKRMAKEGRDSQFAQATCMSKARQMFQQFLGSHPSPEYRLALVLGRLQVNYGCKAESIDLFTTTFMHQFDLGAKCLEWELLRAVPGVNMSMSNICRDVQKESAHWIKEYTSISKKLAEEILNGKDSASDL